MSRIIIENRSCLDDLTALSLVRKVIMGGRVSGCGDKAQYCYYTTFKIFAKGDCKGTDICVGAFKNKKSDRFVVVNHKNGNVVI